MLLDGRPFGDQVESENYVEVVSSTPEEILTKAAG